jgi:hypothetical protein
LSEREEDWSAGAGEADREIGVPGEMKSGGRMRTSFLITLARVAPG